MALGAEPVAMPYKAGEQNIPTVRGVAKCLIRFLDSTMNIWISDFEPPLSDPIDKKGVQSIDHIAQTMGFDEMLSWTQFYTSIFSMVKSHG